MARIFIYTLITYLMSDQLLTFQRNEITGHTIYKKLAEKETGNNKKTLNTIAENELKHYEIWKKYTKQDVSPSKLTLLKFAILSKIAGTTFAIKLMEKVEKQSQVDYKPLSHLETKKIIAEEAKHEEILVKLINEEKLNYIGSIVLGLSDALVEITGTIAGLTFALSNNSLVAMAGAITGIAASLSMANSSYLSAKSDNKANPFRSALYTGLAYVATILFLVLPYFLTKSKYLALGSALGFAALVIIAFTFFISVIKEKSYFRSFMEMFLLCFGVAGISFLIGLALKYFVGVSA